MTKPKLPRCKTLNINVTKARPSTLEAATVPPAQPILLPGGTETFPSHAGSNT